MLRDLPVELGQGLVGRFAAIGNHHLLKASSIFQIQCSRCFFAYARDAQGRILKDRPPRIETAAFRESCEVLLEEAAHGAVEIIYKGVEPRQVDELVRAAVVLSRGDK